MGFYPPDALVHEAQRRGLEVLGPDVNASETGLRGRDERGGDGVGRAAAGQDRPRLRRRGGRGGRPGCDRRAAAGRRLPRPGRPGRPLGRVSGGAAAAGLGRCLRPAGSAPVGRAEALGSAAEAMAIADGAHRRPALWEAGAASRAARCEDGTQLALALDGAPSPALPPLGPWERAVADYRMTGMTLDEHPMELLRPQLDPRVVTSADIQGTRDGAAIRVAGMVTARQRPATAKGVVFMLLEDEHGVINLVVPPPVAERCRLAVRTAGLRDRPTAAWSTARGPRTWSSPGSSGWSARAAPERSRLSDRGRGRQAQRLSQPTPRTGRRDRQRARPSGARSDVAELAAALPPGHAFGRRGR